MPSPMDDVICTCLSRVYADHAWRTDRLACRLEHALPIRHTFFRLKRVPHFQTRDDLHGVHSPAYSPIYRLDNASLESLSQKSKAGCRRVLLEGDLGTGKTLVCHRLLHEWAKAMQFFRNVKIDQPCITIACEEEVESVRQRETSQLKIIPTTGQGTKESHMNQKGELADRSPGKTSVDVDARATPQKWNLDACTAFSGASNLSTNALSVIQEGIPRSKSHDGRLSQSGEEKDAPEVAGENSGEGAKGEENKDGNTLDDGGHRSRKSVFDESHSKSPSGNREKSQSAKNVRKGSRSRSTSETERESKNRRRDKERLICNDIPQKYLSLLNIAVPGEGSFESPGLSRARTLREPRRQRPSRLTSNLTDYKAMIYVPCVRLALSELLAKCNNARVRHYYLAASVLLDLLNFSDVPHHTLSFDAVYHWVLANRDDICIIFDNVDASEAWERLIADAYHDRDGFGKIIVAATPGRISKRDVDSLFYCYGLSNEYSNRILMSRLRTEAPQVIDRITFLLNSSHIQELLCNPLSLSLLSAYFRSVREDDSIPEHLSELLEHLIHHAMANEINTIQKMCNGRKRRFSLQNVCETVAFECLENDTNYFSKQKFPQQFWTRHLCDCRVLHEVHEVANFGSMHEKPPSPVTNQSITPDSDSVHSSTSSNLELINSDVSSSNQSLASTADSETPKNENGSAEPSSSLNNLILSGSGTLLQVPQIHTADPLKKMSERPKTLSLDAKKQMKPALSQSSQTNGEIVSFTSRCIRDFLASKRVCRYLQSDRDCESFIQRLIAKPQFYPVLRLTVRSLYISERSDLILNLLDMLLTSQELNYSGSPYAIQASPPRGPSPTMNGESPIRNRLPHRYRVSNSDCPFRAKREEQKQRRSSTSILGTCFEGGHTLKTSSSFNRLLVNTSTLTPYSVVQAPEVTRGYLEDFKEALIWLAETDNSEPYIGAVSNRFPDTLVISYQDCPSETIEHFICLVKRSVPAVKEIVLYMSGFYTQWDLGLALAQAIQELQNVTCLRISMKCVVETSFLIDFICECFDKNNHIETLSLEGPMNVAENLTPSEHKRIQKIFNDPSISLKTLILDHYSYQHRVGYILNCLPNNFANLQIKKCNLDSVPTFLNNKISKAVGLTSLMMDNCYVPALTLGNILKHIREHVNIVRLTTLELTLLSSARRFSKTDAKKAVFKPSVTFDVCRILAEIVKVSPSLTNLLLSYNGISDEKAKILLHATVHSKVLASLDLTGNLISNDIQEDVITLLKQAVHMNSLLLGDNNITKETRSAIIKESLSRHDLRLSL